MAESEESRKEETHSRFEEFDRRIAESKASQREAINEFEKTLRETAGDLTEQMKQAREQAENGVGAVRTALEHELAGREATQEQLGSLTREVAELQEKLQQQLETSERLSGVLNSLAGVFSAQLASRMAPEKSESKAPRAEDRAEPAERSSSTSDSGQDSSGSGARELDNALNRLFQDS